MPAMLPPETGIRVRMYRQGHGDCFLLATKKTDGTPFYMLIDCGLWPGSEVADGQTIDLIVKSIAEATNNHIDVVLITHEHDDHVNGFAVTEAGGDRWADVRFDEVWLAWTEDGTDEDANDLRDRFDDTLLGLVAAMSDHDRLGVKAADDRIQMISDVIALHTGERDAAALAAATENRREQRLGISAAGAPDKIPGLKNKKAIQSVRKKAQKRVRFLSPGKEIYEFGAVGGVRIYGLGPPRDPTLLVSLDPKGTEGFKKFALDHSALSLVQVLAAKGDNSRAGNPFSPRHGVAVTRLQEMAGADTDFFKAHHGYKTEAGHGPDWRRIDSNWLDAAEALALRLNDEVNNTSLVIAIELPATRKVLLFSGDAQRGNWISWSKLEWKLSGGATVAARDLLSRTVLYKVGHHGSHNATLTGQSSDDYANLNWLGRGEYGKEFTAMIPANKTWAYAKKPHAWKHPLKSIDDALQDKARGRVFRTDQAAGPPQGDTPNEEWEPFKARRTIEKLYFEYDVTDTW